MRLAHESGSAVDVAVRQRLVDLCCGELQFVRADARVIRRGNLQIGESQRSLVKLAGVHRLVEARTGDASNTLQAVFRFAARRVGSGSGTVVQQCIVTDWLEVTPLAHGETRFLEEFVDLTVHDAGIDGGTRVHARVVGCGAARSRGSGSRSLRCMDGGRR